MLLKEPANSMEFMKPHGIYAPSFLLSSEQFIYQQTPIIHKTTFFIAYSCYP